MKNKKMLYILIPGTLIVWGLIIFKIVKNMHSDESPAVQQSRVSAASSEAVSDTFSIHPAYRDPFLGRSIQPVDVPERQQPAKPVVKTPEIVKPPTPWPAVVYSGIIKNQKSNKEMILLQINGQGYMMKTGETANGIELFKVYRDSVEVHFSKEKKIIYK